MSAAFFGDQLARCGVTGERDERDRGVPDERVADGHAVAGHDLEHARRQHLLRELDEPQHRQRRLLGRLDDLDVAGRERRPHLPHRHEERVVPRADPGHDAERLAANHRRVAGDVLRRRLALEVSGRAGEEAQVVGHDPRLVHRHPPWLADVLRLEPRELLGVLVDHVGELEQQLHPVLRSLVPPLAPGLLRGVDRAFDILGRPARHLRDHLAGRGVEHLHRLARRRVDELAADEHLVLGHRHAHVRDSSAVGEIARERSSPGPAAGTYHVPRADLQRSGRTRRMKILVVGTGGVGSPLRRSRSAARSSTHCALADYDAARPQALVAALDDDRSARTRRRVEHGRRCSR